MLCFSQEKKTPRGYILRLFGCKSEVQNTVKYIWAFEKPYSSQQAWEKRDGGTHKETLQTAQVHHASHSKTPTIGVDLLDLPTSSIMWQFDINQRVSRVDLIFALSEQMRDERDDGICSFGFGRSHVLRGVGTLRESMRAKERPVMFMRMQVLSYGRIHPVCTKSWKTQV